MKKVFAVALMACLVLSLAACSKSGNTNTYNKYSTAARQYVFAGSTSTGSFYMQSTPIAALWEKLPYVSTFTVEATTGAIENYMLISKGSADVGIADAYSYWAALNKADPFKEVTANCKAICSAAPSPCHFIVRASSDIKSISDFKGKSLGTGTVGSGTEFEVRLLLEELGIKYDDLGRVDYIGVGEALSQLKDGKIDIAVALAADPNSSLVDTALSTDIRIIEFSEDEVELLIEKCSWLAPSVIPAGTYNNCDQDIRTVAAPEVLFINENVPKEVVYEMTKTLYENMESLQKGNSAYYQWSFDASIENSVPLHPGARQFYVEQGIIAE